jgi:hypothetical protein
MAKETIGEQIVVFTDDHPPRSDSKTYIAARKFLMNTRKGGCLICGGVPNTAHPELEAVGNPKGLQDHHGGGIYFKDILVGLNLFGTEWSMQFSADIPKFARLVQNLNLILKELGEDTYDAPVTSPSELATYVDSTFNANVKICQPHHVGTQTQHSPDALGHESCGIHEIPFPIWLAQLTNDWGRWDMWSGTTGTVAVAPAAIKGGRQRLAKGHAVVLHAHPASNVKRGDVLTPDHPLAIAAHLPQV